MAISENQIFKSVSGQAGKQIVFGNMAAELL
jgi:hypothetical protein